MNLKSSLSIFKILGLVFFGFVVLFLGVYAYFIFTQETLELNDGTRKNLPGKFIKLSKGFVHYELAGADTGKTVILIHGAGSGYYAWDKNFYDLASKGYRTLRYDLYGRGYSDRPDVVYDSQLFEQQLIELVDSLHLPKPFALASVSMGAIVAVHYCVNHSEQVDKLILVDPAALNDPKKPFTLRMPFLSDLLMTFYWYPRAVGKQMREFYDPTKVAEYAVPSHQQMKYKGFKSAMKSIWLNTLNQNVNSELYKINEIDSLKVLLLWGKYDPLIPPVLSEKYLEAIPRIEYHEIDSAGHLANYERPSVVNKFITDFLEK